MASGGRELSLLLVGLLWTASLTLCFNLEPRTGQLFSYPYADKEGRESYFGFSVALQHNEATNTNWLMVGAPRANSSIYNANQITEPGALFKCNLSGLTCEEYIVDRTGNTESNNEVAQFSYQDLKNYGWLGGSLDSQPQLRDERQVTAVCAPRWKNQIYYRHRYMNGVCYWFDDNGSYVTIKKKLPLVNYEKQTTTIYGVNFYHYGHGQAGMSVHFPDDQTRFIVGAPGVFNWHGTVILFEDTNWNYPDESIARRRRQTTRIFTRSLVPNPFYIPPIRDCDLFGYAVTSGRFSSRNKILYAGGAPRGADSYGKVIVFDFPDNESSNLEIKFELKGSQLGEYFGAALTAADINGDGLSDLVVGSPMYSLSDTPDVGRVHTFLSNKELGLSLYPKPHYGNQVNLARFGTTLASGDLNADRYEDIVVGAPWEGDGAVYIFLGSTTGLKQRYSQRLSPENFNSGLRGFGMSLSRGIDIDKNGYPDLAIGSFMSGHVAVVKARPVAVLSGYLRASPPNVAWEGSATLDLQTCLQYKGHRVPKRSSIQVTLTLDHDSPAPRAVFSDNTFIQTFTQSLVANNVQATCKTNQVTVKEDKIDPDQPIVMKMEYEIVSNPGLQLIKQPMTNPGETHSNITRVGILKGCAEETCRVDMTFDADLDLGRDNKLVVGQRTNPVLRVRVSNNGEPVYLPTMAIKVDPPLTLLLPPSHDCEFFNADLRTSLECSLSNPIREGGMDTVEVSVDTSQLADGSSNPGIEVQVAGEGEEMKPQDNHLFMTLQLEAHASLELYGHSKEEQVFYKQVGEDLINATVNPRFTHTFLLIKKGPTRLGQVDLNIDIPVNITNGQKLVKLYPPKTDFLQQPFHCKLNSSSFDIDVSNSINEDDSISIDGSEKSGSNDAEPHMKPIIMSVGEEVVGTQYFNCSSSLMKCVQLSCHIYNWPQDTESAKISLDLEVDLSVMAKHINLKGGAVLMSTARASIQSLSPQLAFVGKKVATGKIVTNIQPDTLQTSGIPWWVILLAVLGGLLLLGLMAYGLYKTGFFKREKLEEMKAHRANLISPDAYGACNQGLTGD